MYKEVKHLARNCPTITQDRQLNLENAGAASADAPNSPPLQPQAESEVQTENQTQSDSQVLDVSPDAEIRLTQMITDITRTFYSS